MRETKEMIAEIDLMENAVYRVRDGVIDKLHTPGDGFGRQVIIWQDGKPVTVEIRYTQK